MPFIKQLNKDFVIENNIIKLTDEYINNNKHKFKKITGSRFSSVLNLNEYTSELKTWCIMVGIYVEPMDELISAAGNIIEPKIKQYVEHKLNVKYIQYDPYKIKFDLFSDNEIFGGIPDGEPIINGKVDYSNNNRMLEIKTTSIDSFLYKKINNVFVLQKENNKPIIKSIGTKKAKWFDSNNNVIIPNEYKFQLGLYCYLRNVNKGIFAVCFLTVDDYVNPQLCNVYQREIQLVNYDIDLNKFQIFINYATNWYNNHIKKGISPSINKNDWEWIKTELNL